MKTVWRTALVPALVTVLVQPVPAAEKSAKKNHSRRAPERKPASVASAAKPGSSVIEAVPFSSEALHLNPHWLHGDGEAPSGNSIEARMSAAKQAAVAGQADACLKAVGGVWAKAKGVQPWLLALELGCAAQLKPSEAASDRIHKVIAKAEKNLAWLLHGAHVENLRAALFKAYLATFESDLKANRARAVKSVERLEELQSFGDDSARAKLWRAAAELAFATQDAVGARELLKRSLSESDEPETRARLAVVEGALKAGGSREAPTSAPAKGPVPAPNPEADVSKEELELAERATAALKAGDLVSAADDLARLLREFPGGSRAKWAAERMLEVYWSISEKADGKLAYSRSQILRKMERVDGDRLAEWARALFGRGQWADALAFATSALEKTEGARQIPLLELAGKAAVATDQFALARKHIDRLLMISGGSASGREGLLRSALLHFRQAEYPQAASDLERLVALPQLNSLELPARYWLWRSYQRLNSERAVETADELLRKYPFSYYGLRARLERAGGTLEWKPDNGKFQAKFFLTSAQRLAWERAQVLLKAGWLDEAQAEIAALPAQTKAEDKAMRAIIWAAAGSYARSTKLANEAWDEMPELRRPPLVQAAFPKDFTALIESQADLRKIDRDLVRGLVKQESSFNPRAVSTSNAYGLMQIIGPTARELAQDLKVTPFNLPDDMFQPARNVQFGTLYLARLLQKYSGHVPLALAAYNAGPTRIDRWTKARPSLQNLGASRSSAPEDELWFDEIPYAETSTYVKAILRNLLMYKMLDNGRVQVPDPLWAFGSEKL